MVVVVDVLNLIVHMPYKEIQIGVRRMAVADNVFTLPVLKVLVILLQVNALNMAVENGALKMAVAKVRRARHPCVLNMAVENDVKK
jgi:hypothetical protein